jgi:type VI secretion system secreted protein Hcp
MAADVYLWIDGVKGESNDDKHKDWIELVAADWGVAQPTSGTVTTGGGHTIGRAEFRPITCAKLVDLCSPKLMELTAAGKTIPKARLAFVRADGSGSIRYYEVELDNVLVADNKKTYPGSGLLHETFELRYTKISEKYTQQKISGGTGGNASSSWNLATNKAT